jgi:hypothetical protein
MLVEFRKEKRELCVWTAYPPKRRPVSAVGGSGHERIKVPHDLAQLIVERDLGHQHGFWGCLAEGATFRSLVAGGRRRTQPGRAIIAAHVEEIDAAELAFHEHVARWLRGEPTPAGADLDDALAAWRALEEHEHLTVDFPIAPRNRVRPRR